MGSANSVMGNKHGDKNDVFSCKLKPVDTGVFACIKPLPPTPAPISPNGSPPVGDLQSNPILENMQTRQGSEVHPSGTPLRNVCNPNAIKTYNSPEHNKEDITLPGCNSMDFFVTKPNSESLLPLDEEQPDTIHAPVPQGKDAAHTRKLYTGALGSSGNSNLPPNVFVKRRRSLDSPYPPKNVLHSRQPNVVFNEEVGILEESGNIVSAALVECYNHNDNFPVSKIMPVMSRNSELRRY